MVGVDVVVVVIVVSVVAVLSCSIANATVIKCKTFVQIKTLKQDR